MRNVIITMFILPTYPRLLVAVEMDDNSTTRVGRYVFNRPFLAPTLMMITITAAVSFPLAAMVSG